MDGKLDAETAVPHKVMGKAITRYGFIGIGSEAGAFDGPTGPNWALQKQNRNIQVISDMKLILI